MSMDIFSWLVLLLLFANLGAMFYLLGAMRNLNLKGPIEELTRIASSIEKTLITIQSTVIEHKRDDKEEHMRLWNRMGELSGRSDTH